MKKILNKLRDKRGGGVGNLPLVLCIILLTIMLSMFVLEGVRLYIIARGISSNLENGVNTAVLDNYEKMYSHLKESGSGSYVYSISDFEEEITSPDIYGKLTSNLGLVRNGEYYEKRANGGVEYIVEVVSIVPKNPDRGVLNDEAKFIFEVMLKVKIPFSGIFRDMGEGVPLTVRRTSAIENKW